MLVDSIYCISPEKTMPFQPNRAHVTRNGITVDITRSPTGDMMTATVVRVSRVDSRLMRQGRHSGYGGTPVHEVTTRYAPFYAGLALPG